MRKIFGAIVCASLIFGAQPSFSKTGLPEIDAVIGMEIACQKADAESLRNCEISIEDAGKFRARELRFAGLGENRADFVGIYGFGGEGIVIESIEYENVSGQISALIAMLASEDIMREEIIEAWSGIKIGKVSIKNAEVSDDGQLVSIKSAEAADVSIEESGPVRVNGVEIMENGEKLAEIASISLDRVSLPGISELMSFLDIDFPALKGRAAQNMDVKLENMAVLGISIPFADISVEKISLNYEGDRKNGSKGKAEIAGVKFPGELLSIAGLSGLPGTIKGSIESRFGLSPEKANEAPRLTQFVHIDLDGLATAKAYGVINLDEKGVWLPMLRFSITDKGLVKAMPLPARFLLEAFVNANVPGIANTLDKFLSEPGQSFSFARMENEKDGVVAEASETGPEDWGDIE